jgi:hypothetical protein
VNSYTILVLVHIIAVIALIGPLILTPKWLYLYRYNIGQKILKDIHLLTGISGLIVLISGSILLWLQDAEMLSSLWMKISIGIFIVLQIFDHFWADKQEEALENSPEVSVKKIKNPEASLLAKR